MLIKYVHERNARQHMRISEVSSGLNLKFIWGTQLIVLTVRHNKGNIYHIDFMAPTSKEFISSECLSFIDKFIGELKEEEVDDNVS